MALTLQIVWVIFFLMVWMIPYNFAEDKCISDICVPEDCFEKCEHCNELLSANCFQNRSLITENVEKTEKLILLGVITKVILCVVIMSFSAVVCALRQTTKQKYNTKGECCVHTDRTSWNLKTYTNKYTKGDLHNECDDMQLRKNSKDYQGGIVHIQSSAAEQKKTTRVAENIQELKERMECKICLSAYMSIAFLPCSHMVACEKCSMLLDRCPVCRAHIKGLLPTIYN